MRKRYRVASERALRVDLNYIMARCRNERWTWSKLTEYIGVWANSDLMNSQPNYVKAALWARYEGMRDMMQTCCITWAHWLDGRYVETHDPALNGRYSEINPDQSAFVWRGTQNRF